MTTALYRRYRPESFADVIGQSHVTEPLMAALRADRVTHAYLFSGPRGCGKTTSARILARCLNCAQGPTDTPCGVCDSCRELSRNGGGSLDVVEIDAASHNGVDDARELRERAAFAPVRDRYKIFILDEAHMVTPQGFNALLKLVEEPPPHVKFIFATTEPERVIGTIRSRTHHYPFRLVPPEELTRFLEELCAREGVRVEGGVLPLVIRAGGGSVRDSLSVLDQLIAGTVGGQLDYRQAVALLGYTDETLLDQIVSAFAADDGAGVFRVVERVIEAGQEPRRFVEDLLQRLRDLLVVALTGENARDALAGLPADVFARMRDQAKALGAPALSAAADLTNEALTSMVGATSPRLHVELLCARVLLALGELQGIAPGRGDHAGRAAAGVEGRGHAPATFGQGASPAAGASRPGPAAQPAPGGHGGHPDHRLGHPDQRPGYGARPAQERPAASAPQQAAPAGMSPADVIASAAADWGDDLSQPAAPTRGRGMDDAPPAAATPAAAPSSPEPAAPRQEPPALQRGQGDQDWGTREFLPAEHGSYGGGAPAQQAGPTAGAQREPWGGEPQRRAEHHDQPAARSRFDSPQQWEERRPEPNWEQGDARTQSRGEYPAQRAAAWPTAAPAAPQHQQPAPQPVAPQQSEPQPVVQHPEPQHGTTLSDSGTAGQAEMIRARWPEVLGALRGISQVTWALVSANAHPGPVTDGTFAVHIPAPGILTAFHTRNMGQAVQQALRESLGLDLAVEGVPGGPAHPDGAGGQPHPGEARNHPGNQGHGGDAAPFVDSRAAAADEPEENGRAHGHPAPAHHEPAPRPVAAERDTENAPPAAQALPVAPARPEPAPAPALRGAPAPLAPSTPEPVAPALAPTPTPTPAPAQAPVPVAEAGVGEDDWPEVAPVGGAAARAEEAPPTPRNPFASNDLPPSVAEAAVAAIVDAWPEVPAQLSSNFAPPAPEPWAPVHDIRSGRRIDGGGGGNVVQTDGLEDQQEQAMAAHPSAARPLGVAGNSARPAGNPAAAAGNPAGGMQVGIVQPAGRGDDYDDNEISLDDPEVQMSAEAGVHVMLRVLGGQILEERDLTQN
ncbi:DNA polymerase III subunit gamma and tau [Buchananella felis]|uniref:DNA polymerase III subunit gamma and tau n=1 Tax=Buchananella felis TaxID=3231492 RepID=UPI003526DC52